MSEPPVPRHIRIFLSSPGDVSAERQLAQKVIDDLPYDPLLRGKVTFEIVAWDKPGAGTPMLATMTPQEAINQGLPKPSECDIVIVIFWSRMGTPLPHPEYQKSNGEPYWSGTEWEYDDAMQAARQFQRPEVVIYRRTDRVPLFPDMPDFMAKYEQWQRVQAFFAVFTDPETGAIRQGYNSYDTPDDFRSEFETHLKVLVNRFLTEPPTSKTETITVMEAPVWEGSPFPGLRAFTEDDAPIFFGRGRETDALVERLNENRFVAVVGASGSGKSSLVGAGLIPRLRGNAIEGSKDWQIVMFKPGEAGDNPFEALYSALLKTFPALQPMALEAGRVKRNFLDDMLAHPEAFWDTCVAALKNMPDWAEILLIIDQFEELFSLVAKQYRPPFVDMLAKLAGAERVRTVVTMRSDFYHRCVEYEALAALLRDGSFPLAAPKMTALYEMITRPAERSTLVFETGLPQQILDDTGDEPGALALLAYLLDELYRMGSTDGRLMMSEYKALGGVQGAIGVRADAVFETLDADVQNALPTVFREIVEVDERGEPTRRRVELAVAAPTQAAQKLVDVLTDERARLLIQDRNTAGRPTIEVAHEALLRNWPRLRDWIEEERDNLRMRRQIEDATQEWAAHGRTTDYMLTGGRLEDAQAWLERFPARDLEREYVVASRQEVERQAKQKAWEQTEAIRLAQQAEAAQGRAARLLRYLVGVLLIATIVSLGMLLLTLDRQHQLDETRLQNFDDRGNIYLDNQRYGEAVAEFTRMIELSPESLDAYFKRGTAYLNGRKYWDALGDFDHVLAIDADYAGALTQRQIASEARVRAAAFNITSRFEQFDYSAYTNNDAGIVSYGRFQFTVAGGSLYTVIERYTSNSLSPIAIELRSDYLDRLQLRDQTLRNDERFEELLKAAANDSAMQAAQDEVAGETYWDAMQELSIQPRGIQTPLGQAMLFDMAIQYGIRNGLIGLAEQSLGVPQKSRLGENGITEEALITRVAEVRRDSIYKMADSANLPGLKIRGDLWITLVESGDWQLLGDDNGNIVFRDNPIQVRDP